jgi:hypothetical protein
MTIVEQYAAGMSTLEIAQARNWSVSSVRTHLLKAGVKMRGRTEWRKLHPEKWHRFRSDLCPRPGCQNKKERKYCRQCWNRYHRELRKWNFIDFQS